MPTGRTSELEARFGVEVAAEISAAYETVVLREAPPDDFPLSASTRFAIVQALIEAAEGGDHRVEELTAIARQIAAKESTGSAARNALITVRTTSL